VRSRCIAAPVAVGLIYMRQRLLVDPQLPANLVAGWIALPTSTPSDTRIRIRLRFD
jgi:hypothetical protein